MAAATALLSKKRSDYKAPSHSISKVDLRFELTPSLTTVTSTMMVTRNDPKCVSLTLDGEGLSLLSVSINGRVLNKNTDYKLLEQGLVINTNEAAFELTIVNTINPEANTSLEGLYFSNQAFCTQCEAEGFRKITYFLDRPDVLSVYTVAIVSANPATTYLLSNGNLIEDSTSNEGVRTCVWHDPHPKPCYLFALVAGHFDLLEDEFVTMSGREVALQLYVDEGRLSQGQHALDSLKTAMKWDEDTYGLEYDLDIYMIVAVDFFNMGAMENKGLNVFNSKFVLADPNTATDTDYFNIESIIAHEYFHNWTGNRVTCRDWFQLSLKEGLTVFRDQQFSSDMFSYLKTRIDQVKVMKERQFAEDAGPMSHPIRPDEVFEMNNFYTVTVYDKGAEVIRMLHTLLGKQGFRKGMDEYFSRHDGSAVTCDDFVNAMESANNHDLTHFKRWYSQSGTPIVKVSQKCDSDGNTVLVFEQSHAPTADQVSKQPLYIPIKLECISQTGELVPSQLTNDTFILTETSAKLVLANKPGEVVVSLLQDFSSPVIVEYNYTEQDLILIVSKASSDYAKWEASQRLFIICFKQLYAGATGDSASDIDHNTLLKCSASMQTYAHTLSELLNKQLVTKEVLSQLLNLPDCESCMSSISAVDPQKAIVVYDVLIKESCLQLSSLCRDLYDQNNIEISYQYNKEQANQRELKAICLLNLCHSAHQDAASLVSAQFNFCDNMTDKLSALRGAQQLFEVNNNGLFESLMLSFEQQYASDAVVMDKWFALHATTRREDILSHLDLLQSHQQFSDKNPNKVRALIGSFAFYNLVGFHQSNGLGYKYLTDYLLQIDKINPQIASRLITPLIQFSNFNEKHQQMIKHQLQRLFSSKSLSKDLFEKITKALVSN